MAQEFYWRVDSMKEVLFDKENPKGLVREVEREQEEPIEQQPTTEERLEALEGAFMELVGVMFND